MKFYVASGRTKVKLLALHWQSLATRKERNAFSKRHGAKGVVTQGDRLIGLVFEGQPEKPWRPVKSDIAGHAKPDTSRDGKALRAEMDALADYSWMEVARIVGTNGWHPGSFSVPDFRVWGETVVFGVDDRDKPSKDCRRISDVQYEKMLAAQKKRGQK